MGAFCEALTFADIERIVRPAAVTVATVFASIVSALAAAFIEEVRHGSPTWFVSR
jgi:hypothetical protein